jgi:predicted flavoprotein YhiN
LSDSIHTDIAVIGAGAAGLMAAIWAGRTANAHPPLHPLAQGSGKLRVIALDGARSLGAKILVAGGGRCNVTHDHVDESAFAGSSRNAIKKVLRRFDAGKTVDFFRELGVELKREETGKLFPVTDKARTVLNALLKAARDADVEIIHPWRVDQVLCSPSLPGRGPGGGSGEQTIHSALNLKDLHPPPHPLPQGRGNFVIRGSGGELSARRIILATGGRSLPKTGSDGHGYEIAKSLGQSITTRIFPGLVPLTLPKVHFITRLSGLTLPATLEVRSPAGKRLVSFTNSTLCTHFGLSGPSVLDISRYYLDAKMDSAGSQLIINWLPGETTESMDAALQTLGKTSPVKLLGEKMPERLARELCAHAEVDAASPGHQLRKEQRRALARAICEMVLPITGDRGFGYAEVTAGGVPLSEIHLETMESRICPGLHLCGEICDVDGRIGGFNFQWAWASGYVAGVSCALSRERPAGM